MIHLVVTYYNQPAMLARQLREWGKYPESVARAFRFLIVDDGSQTHPASEVVHAHLMADVDVCLPVLYRIDTDIPWNQHGARNLAARDCIGADWLLMLDIDHVLTAENAARLVAFSDCVDPAGPLLGQWYKFPRERIGAADETRSKDLALRGIPADASGVAVNPGMNCFLVTRDAYWKAGGYNEDFCGTYGGDSEFLRELRTAAGEPLMLNDVWLQVHTRHSVSDANEQTLDRNPALFRERLAKARAAGKVRGHAPYCRFKWRKVL